MKRLAVVALALAVGCAPVESTTRTERGPLLRTYSRPQVVAGGTQVDLEVRWPELKLALMGYDTCRSETVEEFAEDTITERTSRSAGPALATGIANVLAAGVLYGVSYSVSSVPNVGYIDQAGRYGPSTQQYVQGSALITLLVGVPALAVGLIGYLRSGVEVQTAKVEQVVSQKDARCNDRAATGVVALVGGEGPVAAKAAAGGAVAFLPGELSGSPEGLTFDGQPVALDDQAQQRLWAFGACAALERGGAATLSTMAEAELFARAERLRQCRTLRGEATAEAIRAVDGELLRRREHVEPEAVAPGGQAGSYEQALALHPKTLKLAAGSAELARLERPKELQGQAVRVAGVVVERPDARSLLVQVGEKQLLLALPAKPAWGEVETGTRIEAVAVMSGTKVVEGATVPVARAEWVRAAW